MFNLHFHINTNLFRMNRYLTLLAIILVSLTPSFAQKLKTDKPVYDCGQVLYRNPVTASFVLKNTSARSLNVKKVETSCGCTTAFASKHHIGGNKEVTIKATYDAKQLGHFQKEIWIYEDDKSEPVELIIKGVVVTNIKDYSKTYPYTLGHIRANGNEIEFDNVNKGSMPTKTIQILNTSGETIEPVVMHLPDYLKADVTPARIAPDQSGEINFVLISSKLPRMGLSQTSVYLGKFPGDKISQDKEISVSSVLIPQFSSDAASSLNAPQLQLSSTVVEKSKLSGSPDKLKGEIILQNIGKSTLDITSLQMSTIGMQVSLGKTKLEPSESTKLKIQINDNELSQQKKKPIILMITNDPRNPKVVIEIK